MKNTYLKDISSQSCPSLPSTTKVLFQGSDRKANYQDVVSDPFILTQGAKVFMVDYSAYSNKIGNVFFDLIIFKNNQQFLTETRQFFVNVAYQHLPFNLIKIYYDSELPEGTYTLKLGGKLINQANMTVWVNMDDFLSVNVITYPVTTTTTQPPTTQPPTTQPPTTQPPTTQPPLLPGSKIKVKNIDGNSTISIDVSNNFLTNGNEPSTPISSMIDGNMSTIYYNNPMLAYISQGDEISIVKKYYSFTFNFDSFVTINKITLRFVGNSKLDPDHVLFYRSHGVAVMNNGGGSVIGKWFPISYNNTPLEFSKKDNSRDNVYTILLDAPYKSNSITMWAHPNTWPTIAIKEIEFFEN